MNVKFNPEAGWSYDADTKTFRVSEKEVPFATKYLLSANGIGHYFEFTHSTGPEFEKTTKWIYKAGDYTLEVCNDAEMCKVAAKNYLDAKTKRPSVELNSLHSKNLKMEILDYFFMTDDPQFDSLKRIAKKVLAIPDESDRNELIHFFETEAGNNIDYFK